MVNVVCGCKTFSLLSHNLTFYLLVVQTLLNTTVLRFLFLVLSLSLSPLTFFFYKLELVLIV